MNIPALTPPASDRQSFLLSRAGAEINLLQPLMTTDRETDEEPVVIAGNNDADIADAPRSMPSQTARDLAAAKASLAASHFAAASRTHLAAATQDLLLATRVNSSVASAASAASADLAGWGDLRDALSEKLAALGSLSADSIKEALGPRVEALQKEADELDVLSKKLARAVGVSCDDEDEGEDDDDEDDCSDSEREKREKTKKPPTSSSSSATAAATAAASAAASAATAAASKLWRRWAPGASKKR